MSTEPISLELQGKTYDIEAKTFMAKCELGYTNLEVLQRHHYRVKTDVSLQIFEEFIQSLGGTDCIINRENYQALMELAKEFGAKELQKELEDRAMEFEAPIDQSNVKAVSQFYEKINIFEKEIEKMKQEGSQRDELLTTLSKDIEEMRKENVGKDQVIRKLNESIEELRRDNERKNDSLRRLSEDMEEMRKQRQEEGFMKRSSENSPVEEGETARQDIQPLKLSEHVEAVEESNPKAHTLTKDQREDPEETKRERVNREDATRPLVADIEETQRKEDVVAEFGEHILLSTDILTLAEMGVNPEYAKTKLTTLAGDRCLCVLEISGGEDGDSNMAKIDLRPGVANRMLRMPLKVDTLCMHPAKDILAVARGPQVQIFDLSGKTKLGALKLQEGDSVQYWKWVNDDTLAFVAGGAVHHWVIQSGQESTVFFLESSLAGMDIVAYDTTSDGKWAAVTGLGQENNATVGKMQLFSREKGISEIVPGCYAAAFATFEGSHMLLCVMKDKTGIHLHSWSLANGQGTARNEIGRYVISEDSMSDYPVSLVVAEQCDMTFMFTKSGFLHIMQYIAPFVYFSTCPIKCVQASLASDGGVVILDQDGRLQKIRVINRPKGVAIC